jgi:hypothetical protein
MKAVQILTPGNLRFPLLLSCHLHLDLIASGVPKWKKYVITDYRFQQKFSVFTESCVVSLECADVVSAAHDESIRIPPKRRQPYSKAHGVNNDYYYYSFCALLLLFLLTSTVFLSTLFAETIHIPPFGWEATFHIYVKQESVARERLVKTEQVERSLAGAVMICESRRSAMAL